ncbi:MAG: CHAD domain-containing protein [Candidatus Limnocylindrales bacterium]
MTVDRPVEIELKYRVRDRATGERLLAADVLGPFRATSGARTAQHEDRYIDTPDGALARAGFAARLRLTNGGTIVTVKSTTPAEGALARREELEGPADRTAEPRDWPASAARSLMLELCGDAPLVELVTVRQLRRKRRLKGDDAAAELSLDEVDVVSRGRVIDRFVELEVELTYGNESRLEELASFLRADPGLTPATGSKLDAALAASAEDDESDPAGSNDRGPAPVPVMSPIEVDGPAEAADRTAGAATGGSAVEAPADLAKNGRKQEKRAARAAAEAAAAYASGAERSVDTADTASTPAGSAPIASDGSGSGGPEPLVVGKNAGVVGEDTVAEAGRKVLRFHLARMLAREAGTRNGGDPEELHSMRVATRRMRAAWRVFGDGFRPARTKRHRRELREIAGRLGAVRDLDVLIEAGEAYLELQPHQEQLALQPLFTAWRAQREDARVLLIRELDSDGYGRWVDEFREFVRTDGLGAMQVLPTAPHRIRDTAASRIWTAYEQVRAYEPVLRWSDVATLHELRIAAKWLRYTLEFVRECLGPEAAVLIERVTALQDHLGLLHDADVAASMTRAFLVERAGRLSETETVAIGRYLVDREREVSRLRRSVGGPWRGVGGLTFRRGLGRAVSGL